MPFFVGVLGLVWSVWMLYPFVFAVVGWLVDFWCREDTGRSAKYMKSANSVKMKTYDLKDYCPYTLFMTDIVGGFFFVFICGFLLDILVVEVGLATVLWAVGSIAGILFSILFLPRFAIDMQRSLKYNGKTGKLETIDDIQAQIKELENKMTEINKEGEEDA